MNILKDFNYNTGEAKIRPFVAQAGREQGQAEAALIKERFHKVGAIEISSVGTTIGSHTGPGTVALFFWGKERTL